jgi:hypothetical protein
MTMRHAEVNGRVIWESTGQCVSLIGNFLEQTQAPANAGGSYAE